MSIVLNKIDTCVLFFLFFKYFSQLLLKMNLVKKIWFHFSTIKIQKRTKFPNTVTFMHKHLIRILVPAWYGARRFKPQSMYKNLQPPATTIVGSCKMKTDNEGPNKNCVCGIRICFLN